jgi:FkbM family methyltransferase
MRLVANGTIAVLDLHDDRGISHAVEQCGDLWAYDPRIATEFLPWVPAGGVVVDGGAFIGDHTTAYAEKVGPTGQVWAFEPEVQALNCLAFNTKQYPQVQIVPAALGETKTVRQLTRDPYANGGATALWESAEPEDGVPVVPLDAFWFPQVDLLKLDVEGYELRALKGARLTIATHRPTIIVESGVQLQRYGDTHDALVRYLAHLGYDGGTRLSPQHRGGDVFDMRFMPFTPKEVH